MLKHAKVVFYAYYYGSLIPTLHLYATVGRSSCGNPAAIHMGTLTRLVIPAFYVIDEHASKHNWSARIIVQRHVNIFTRLYRYRGATFFWGTPSAYFPFWYYVLIVLHSIKCRKCHWTWLFRRVFVQRSEVLHACALKHSRTLKVGLTYLHYRTLNTYVTGCVWEVKQTPSICPRRTTYRLPVAVTYIESLGSCGNAIEISMENQVSLFRNLEKVQEYASRVIRANIMFENHKNSNITRKECRYKGFIEIISKPFISCLWKHVND